MTPTSDSSAIAAWQEVRYRVRFDEAGADGRVHASVLLAWAQDAAWVHSTSLGFGREWYAEHALTWLVRGAELRLLDPPLYGDEVVARTEIVGFRRVLARRLTTFCARDGRELARSTTDWALLDGAGRPTRIPAGFTGLVAVPPFEPIAVDTPAPLGPERSVDLRIRARDIDPMGHANNAAYLDYLEEALTTAGIRDPIVTVRRTYRLVFLRPLAERATVTAVVTPAAAGWSIVLSSQGSEITRAYVVTDRGEPDG